MAGRSVALTAIFTPGYAAAEQMTSARQGPWTDIYGLSATLYHAIAGRVPPSAFDRMLNDDYEPLGRMALPGFSPGVLAGLDAGLTVAARDRPQSIAGWRPILGMAEAPAADATMVMGKGATETRHVPILAPPPEAAGATRRTGLWIALAVALLAAAGRRRLLRHGCRAGRIPRWPRRSRPPRRPKRSGSRPRRKQPGCAAESEERQKAEQIAAARQRQADAEAAAKKQFEEETRRKIEVEIAAQKRAEDEPGAGPTKRPKPVARRSRMPARPSNSWPDRSITSARR